MVIIATALWKLMAKRFYEISLIFSNEGQRLENINVKLNAYLNSIL